MKKLVKEISESLGNDAFSFVRESREWLEQFKLEEKKFGKQSNRLVEDKFKFIVRSLIAAFTYLEERHYKSPDVLENIEDFISAHSLENHQKAFLEYIPDIFRICRTAGDYGDLHAFLSKYFTDPKCFQQYLMVSEPIMFSWDNWYDLVIHLNPIQAEKAIIKLFEEDGGLERFQGSIVDTDWRISYLADLIDFCKANNLSKAKKACIEALAHEAIHQNWEVNKLFQEEKYGVLMDGDSEVFEKAYLKNAMGMLSRQPEYYELERLDLDFKNFTDSKDLREFLKEKELKISQVMFDQAKKLLEENDYQELIRLFSYKDFNVIKKNALLLKIFYEVPDLILKASNNTDNEIIDVEDLILMEEISEWKEAASQIRETRVDGSDFERSMFLLETHFLKSDKKCFVNAKEIADRGFAGLNEVEKAKFLEIFLHENYVSLLSPYIDLPGPYDEEWQKWTEIQE
jgi:hypothetical protein